MSLQNEKVNEYLNNICSLIKNKRIHKEIRTELENHITENVRFYEKNGNSIQESIELTLNNLGSSNDLGSKLNKVHKPAIDFKLLFSVGILICLGLLGTFTFNALIPMKFNTISSMFGYSIAKDILYLILSLISFFIGFKFDFRKLKKFSIALYILALAITLFYFFTQCNGDLNYLGWGCRYISSTPVIPVLFLISLSGIYERLNLNTILNKALVLILSLIPLVLMTYTSKFVPMFIYFSLATLVISCIYSKNLKFISINVIIDIILFFLLCLKPFKELIRSSVVGNLGNTWSFGTINEILDKARLFGKAHTGYTTFVNIYYPLTGSIGYFGWIFGIIVIAISIYLVYRLNKTSYFIKNTYGKSISFSITTIFSVEIIWCILMNLNILPFISISSPFLNFGGLVMFLNLFLIGMFINIYKIKTLSKV